MDATKIKEAKKINTQLKRYEKAGKANKGRDYSPQKRQQIESKISELWNKISTLGLTEEEEWEVFGC